MQTEPVVPTQSAPPSKPGPVLRRPVVALSAAFVAGWLVCLGVVQWRQHAQARALASPKTALAASEASPPPAKAEPVSEAKPMLEAVAALPSAFSASGRAGQQAAWAPVEPDAPALPAALPAPPLSETAARQRERDAVAQVFKKNRDNLRVLTGY